MSMYKATKLVYKTILLTILLISSFSLISCGNYAPTFLGYIVSPFKRISPPKGYFDPLITRKFNLGIENNFIELEFNPQNFDYYEIGIADDNESIPMTYKYSGEIKVDVFYGNKLIKYFKADKYFYATYNKSINGFKKLSFVRFMVPINGRYNNLKLRIEVIKGDDFLRDNENIKLFVRVSPYK